MVIVPSIPAILLKLEHPEQIMQTIPGAQQMEQDGKPYIVIPHGLDEVRVLRNMSISAPSPILYQYNWSGRRTPYDHQRETAAFLTLNPRALVLNEIGTGKTLSALWAADYLMLTGVVKKCLVMSRLSTLDAVWGNDIFTEFRHRKQVVLYGTADKRRKLIESEADFHIINHEGFRIVADSAYHKYDLLIIDEATVMRNPTTNFSKLIRKWTKSQPAMRIWLMTGTPTPNSPADAWGMADMMGTVAMPYRAFRDLVMKKVGPWRFIPREDAKEKVEAVLRPSVRFVSNKCLDLPETIYQTRKVALSAVQQKHYDEMLKHFITEMADSSDVISAVNEVTKVQKLVQIACGVAYAEDGKHIELDCTPRINAVKEVLEELGGKALIFTPLVGTLKMLSKKLSADWTVGQVSGSTPPKERVAIFNAFQNGDLQVLIAHPATMAHGLTLTAAKAIIWYGPITSTEQYIQANGRTERIGKRHVTLVVHIESTRLEHELFARVQHKRNLQGLLLNLIERKTGEPL